MSASSLSYAVTEGGATRNYTHLIVTVVPVKWHCYRQTH